MLYGYLPIAIILILLILAMFATFMVLPSISEGRYKKGKGISLKPKDILETAGNASSPKVQIHPIWSHMNPVKYQGDPLVLSLTFSTM